MAHVTPRNRRPNSGGCRVVVLSAALLSVALVSGCGPADGAAESAGTAGTVTPATANTSKDQAAPTLVRVAPFTRGAIRSYIDAETNVQCEWRVDVYAKVGPAYVKELLVDEGQHVEAGQVLLQLEDVDFRIARDRAVSAQSTAKQKVAQAELSLQEAEARERVAQAQFLKAQQDWQRALDAMNGELDILSKKEQQDAKSEFDQRQAEHEAIHLAMEGAKNDLEVAKLASQASDIEVEQAQNDLDHCAVRAPIKGVVQQRDVNAGLLVSPATHLFMIVDPTRLVAALRITDKEVVLIKEPELPAEFRFDPLPDRVFIGRIEATNPEVDPSSGMVKLRARLGDDAIGVVKPGMYAKVRIVVVSHENAVLVSKRAIMNPDGKTCLFLLDGDKARLFEFTPGASKENEVEVLAIGGAPPDPTREVIIVGQDRLRDGDPVTVKRDAP